MAKENRLTEREELERELENAEAELAYAQEQVYACRLALRKLKA